MTDKKKEELGFLKEFLDIVDLKKCSIAPREPPGPDFAITIENKMIGIEVTEYHVDAKHNKGSRSRSAGAYDEKYIERIVNEKVKKNSNLKDICGTLRFKNQKDRPKKAELEKFADDLIKFAADSIRKNKSFKDIMDLHPTDDYPLLKRFLKFVILQRTSFSYSWTVGYSGCISFTEEQLMNVIKPKVEKQHGYNYNNFNELWLLVVFGLLPSQVVTPSWDVENKLRNFDKINCMLKTSNFDKVYLYLRSRDNTIFKWPAWIKVEYKTIKGVIKSK